MLNAHNVLQRAKQGSGFGTANATATALLHNVSSFALSPDLQTRALDQLRGTLAPTHQTTLDHYASSATFEVADESFEDVNYWLDSLFTAATPAGGTGAYTRAYTAPTTAEVEPTFMTLQWGQEDGVWQMNDASVAGLTLSGSNNTGVQVGGSLLGGKVLAGTLASLPDRTVTRMSGCSATVAIDTWAGTMGGTTITDSAFSWELSINSNRQYRSYLGECTPSAWNDQKWNGQLRLSIELNATTQAYLTTMLAATNAILERQVQIKYTSGSLVFQIQFAGHTMSAPELFQDKNGVVTYDLVLDGVYHSTLTNWLKINTTSAISALA
ncbi:MAG: hypothetical protein M0P37_07220 [Synergistaceae bacterium]|jgi:hypothetical protein|nr:hypothetical protein [Synergistaceae bacterium]